MSKAKKTLIVIQCWLTKGQDLDENMQAIVWTEIDCDTMLVNRGHRSRMKTCSSLDGQNDQSVHWGVPIHSGLCKSSTYLPTQESPIYLNI